VEGKGEGEEGGGVKDEREGGWRCGILKGGGGNRVRRRIRDGGWENRV